MNLECRFGLSGRTIGHHDVCDLFVDGLLNVGCGHGRVSVCVIVRFFLFRWFGDGWLS